MDQHQCGADGKATPPKGPQMAVNPIIENYLGEGLLAKENANMSHLSPAGLLLVLGEEALKKNYLHCIREAGYDDLANWHEQGYVHIHDLGLGVKTPYCSGHSLENLLHDGISAGNIISGPAKRLRSAVNHIINHIGACSNEFAGAQAFNDVDLFLGPYALDFFLSRMKNFKMSSEMAMKMTLEEVDQSMQEMIFHLNYNTRYGGQCVTPDTECLTPEGWKTHEELNVGDLIYVVDPETGELRTDTLTHVNIYQFSGDLLRFKGRSADMLVTPNHRMVYRKSNVGGKLGIIEASKLAKRTVINIPNSAKLMREDNTAWTDDRVRMLAWVLSDAHMETGRCSRIRIYQTEKKYAQEIRELLQRLSIPHTEGEDIGEWGSSVVMFGIHGDAAREWVSITGGGRNKIPAEALQTFSARQARIFIEEYVKADGHIEPNGRTRIAKKHETMVDDLQHMMVLAGIGSTLMRRKPGEKCVTHALSVLKRDVVSISEVENFAYTGKVWCPTTNTGTFIARRNNKVFVTGNSPFSNISLALSVPSDMANRRPLIGGKTLEDRWGTEIFECSCAGDHITYSDLEMWQNIVAEAILNNFLRGDSRGTGFTFPVLTVSVTPEFFDHSLKKKVFELSAKFGNPYFQNYINGHSAGKKIEPADVRSMCCRLQLDNTLLRKHVGGLFGNADQTGSLQVVTMNLPMIALGAVHGDASVPREVKLQEFLLGIESIMEEIRKEQLWKREIVERSFDEGFFSMAKANFKRGFKTFFTTVGFVGLWEAVEFISGDEESFIKVENLQMAEEILVHMRTITERWTEETGKLFNLEATPAESAAHKLAVKMLRQFPEAPHRGTGDAPYLTNSCHIPVEYQGQVDLMLTTQSVLQPIPSGGTVVHLHTGEQLDADGVEAMVRAMCSTPIPYFSVSPVYSRCECCGCLIPGTHEYCPNEHTEEQVAAFRARFPEYVED